MKLVIGNKQTSSWSLRAWLLMKYYNIPFSEVFVKLYAPTTEAELKKHSPSGKVPVLVDGNLIIWDSLAIFEYLNEKYPTKQMWPVDKNTRAKARSVTCEMHSSFQTMLEIMSHDVKNHYPNFDYSKAKKDVERVTEIWTDRLKQSGGPFLFKDFSIADVMYAPVVNRFVTYDVKCEPIILDYIKNIRIIPAHQEWIRGGMNENLK